MAALTMAGLNLTHFKIMAPLPAMAQRNVSYENSVCIDMQPGNETFGDE